MTPSDWAKKIAASWRAISEQFTTARYAVVISSVALFVSFSSLYLAKLSYNLSAVKDEREIRDTMPAIDVQVRKDGASTASVTISIINRLPINITPLDMTAEHSLSLEICTFPLLSRGSIY